MITYRIGSFVLAVVLASNAVGSGVAGDDQLFPDTYPEIIRSDARTYVQWAFRVVGCDLDDGTQRTNTGWRSWHGLDPDRALTSAIDPDERERFRQRWMQASIREELVKAFEIAGAGLGGTPEELAEQAWIGIHGLPQPYLVPSLSQWVDHGIIPAERAGLDRMITVLQLSEPQEAAVRTLHDQFLDVHGLFLKQAYETFDQSREKLDLKLTELPLFQHRDGIDPPITRRRDQIRLEAFARSK